MNARSKIDRNGPETACEAIKAKTRVQTRGKSITAHMTAKQHDHATAAADICKLTDSRFGSAAIWVIAELTHLRAEYGWRRVLRPEWWRLLKGML